MQVFEAARWSDSVPDLLQSHLSQTFNDSGKITATTGLDTNTASDALLLLDIRQFNLFTATMTKAIGGDSVRPMPFSEK